MSKYSRTKRLEQGDPSAYVETAFEKDLLTVVRQMAKVSGWIFYHTYDSRHSVPGFPDCVMIHVQGRRIVYAELKRQDGKESPAQLAFRVAIKSAGGEAYLWRPSDMQEITDVLRGVLQ